MVRAGLAGVNCYNRGGAGDLSGTIPGQLRSMVYAMDRCVGAVLMPLSLFENMLSPSFLR
jgi:hypothetical protein